MFAAIALHVFKVSGELVRIGLHLFRVGSAAGGKVATAFGQAVPFLTLRLARGE